MSSLYQNYLFKVEAIKSGKTYNVFATKTIEEKTYFLFYEGGRWIWADATLFKPSLWG